MGNAALCAFPTRTDADAVIVLKADGNVLTFETTVRVADLILEFPNHIICHSSSLLLLQQVKILSPGTTLTPDQVYFLIPTPGQELKSDGPAVEEDADTDSLLQRQGNLQCTPGSMKFVISPEHFSKIMAGSGAQAKVREEGSSRLKRHLSKKLMLQSKKPSPGSNAA